MKKLSDLTRSDNRIDDNVVTYLNDDYAFCTRCDAKLLLQKGYRPDLPYWVCKSCGQMLINPELDVSDTVWRCDRCGAYMNIQPGFNDNCGKWECTECGYVNLIDDSQVFASDDEFRACMSDPYKGLSDDAMMKLSAFSEERFLGDSDHVILVREADSGKLYVKKLLETYDRGIYDYLLEHPVFGMPRIEYLYESDNCLIVIEEYIEGMTVRDMLEHVCIPEDVAVKIALEICAVLYLLHNLPTPIIHRDIKPSNVIVGEDGRVCLLDMNVAKWYKKDQKADTAYLGTKDYAAPEQVGYGLAASTAKSDIYALGVFLNVMVTGELPKDKKAPGGLWDIVKRCIRLEPDERYSTGELFDVLYELAGLGHEEDSRSKI